MTFKIPCSFAALRTRPQVLLLLLLISLQQAAEPLQHKLQDHKPALKVPLTTNFPLICTVATTVQQPLVCKSPGCICHDLQRPLRTALFLCTTWIHKK